LREGRGEVGNAPFKVRGASLVKKEGVVGEEGPRFGRAFF